MVAYDTTTDYLTTVNKIIEWNPDDQWILRDNNFSTNKLTNICYDGSNNGKFFITTSDKGVFSTIDNFISMVNINNDPSFWYDISSYGAYQLTILQNDNGGEIHFNSNITTVDSKPLTCALSYGAQYAYVTLTDGTVLMSRDYGITWDDMKSFFNKIETTNTCYVTMDSTGQNVYILTPIGIVYRSVNYGVDWTTVDNIYQSGKQMGTLFSGYSNSKMVFESNCGAMYFGNAILTTKNNGVTWKQCWNIGFINKYSDIGISSDLKTVIVCGNGFVLRSIDLGETWNYIFNDSTIYTSLTWLDEHKIILTTYFGDIMISNDGGINWSNYLQDRIPTIFDVSFSSGFLYLLCYNGVDSIIYKYLPSDLNSNLNGIIGTIPGKFFQELLVILDQKIFLNDGNQVYFFDGSDLDTILDSNTVGNNTIGGLTFDNNGHIAAWSLDGPIWVFDDSYNFTNGSEDNRRFCLASNGDEFFSLINSDGRCSVWKSSTIENGYVNFSTSNMNVFGVTLLPDIAISATGQHQTFVTPIGIMACSHDYGRTWEINQNILSIPFFEIDMSSDGRIQVVTTLTLFNGPSGASTVMISKDYGNSWVNISPQDNLWLSISYTDNIIAVLAFDGRVATTSDYGITWNYNDIPDIIITFQIIVTSFNFIVIDLAGRIYISTDSGSSWDTLLPIENTIFLYSSASANGKYINSTCITLNGDNLSNIRTSIVQSSDYGKTFTLNTSINCKQYNLGTCVSKSGQYQIVSSQTQVFVSSDFGYSFKVYPSIMSGLLIRVVMNEDASIIKTSNLMGMMYESWVGEDVPVRIYKDCILPSGSDDQSHFIAVDTSNNTVTINLPKISTLFPSKIREYTFYDLSNKFATNSLTINASSDNSIVTLNSVFNSLTCDTSRRVIKLKSDGGSNWLLLNS